MVPLLYLITESESAHRSRTSSGDETDEDAFVDGLDAEAHLVVGVLAQDHLAKQKKNIYFQPLIFYYNSASRLTITNLKIFKIS